MSSDAELTSGTERWVYASGLDELEVGTVRALEVAGRSVVLARLSDQELYALDNRCPHEGQPLASGKLDGATLTCALHDHRFELKSGKCVRGDEDVETLQVRVRDGRIELALCEANPEAELEKRTKSLKEALVNGRVDQAARDLVRMLNAGAEPVRLALEIAAFDALHGEHGCTSALRVSTDALRIALRYAGSEAALPLLVAADVAIHASKYRPPRRVPPSQDPGREPDGVPARLIALLDAGDAEAADGLVRGALWRKWTRDVVEPWFFEVNAAHFFGFGQGLIYAVKAFDLLEASGFEHARRILPGLTFALASMPREHGLPEWQWFRQRFAQLEPRLSELWSRADQRALSDDERKNVTRAILDGSREEAWHAVIGAWASGGKIECVLNALSRAAAERWWRFDVAVDRDATVTEGWLDVTHPFAYASALRATEKRYRRPSLLKLVLYGVHLVNHKKPLDMPADRWTAIDAKGRVSFIDRERLLLDLVDMIRERSPVEAQRAALAYLSLGGSIDALRATLCDLVLKDFYTSPEVTAHAVTLAVTTCDEASKLPDSDRSWPLRAFIRMLASPLRERSLETTLHGAKRLVEQGLAPKSRL